MPRKLFEPTRKNGGYRRRRNNKLYLHVERITNINWRRLDFFLWPHNTHDFGLCIFPKQANQMTLVHWGREISTSSGCPAWERYNVSNLITYWRIVDTDIIILSFSFLLVLLFALVRPTNPDKYFCFIFSITDKRFIFS